MNRATLLAHLARMRANRAPAADEVDAAHVGTPIAQAVARIGLRTFAAEDHSAKVLPPAHTLPLLP